MDVGHLRSEVILCSLLLTNIFYNLLMSSAWRSESHLRVELFVCKEWHYFCTRSNYVIDGKPNHKLPVVCLLLRVVNILSEVLLHKKLVLSVQTIVSGWLAMDSGTLGCRQW